jgi:CHAT domain-containing protein/predicted negative regulator of RcsB-dependent stress response
MNRQNLAKKLVNAKTERERNMLLRDNSGKVDVELAIALKEICYAAWTNEPTKAQKTAKAIKTLLEIKPEPEIKAYALWVYGIGELTNGKFEAAIEFLERSAKVFTEIGKLHEAAKTGVAKLYPLALLGKYDQAVDCGESSLRIFEQFSDELGAGKIEMNLSNIVSRRDQHASAEKYCLSARSRFSALGEKEWLTMAENSLANTYSETNDFVNAEKFYEKALTRARREKMRVTEAEIKASLGNLAKFRGKFDKALSFLEQSRQTYEDLHMPHQTAIAELEIADIYLELNLSKEAFTIYQNVTEKLRKLKMQSEEARARANFGKSAFLLNNNGVARKEFKKSARLFLAEKNEAGAAAVKLNEANLELMLGNFQHALNLVNDAENLLSKSENLRHTLTATWLRGEALFNTGNSGEAEKILSKTVKDSIKQEQLNVGQAALNSLGNLALRNGDVKKAKTYFQKSMALVEKLRAPLPAEGFRMAFLANKQAPYESLARIFLAENDLENSFIHIEKARARALGDSLNFQFQARDDFKASEKLVEKLERFREELNWLYSRLNRAGEKHIGGLHEKIGLREKQISNVMRQIESTRSVTFKKSRTEENSSELRELQKQIGKRKALIEFVKFEDQISAFIISENSIDFAANLVEETEIIEHLESLQFQFGALRFGANIVERFMPELKKRADYYLMKLYEKLISPLASYLKDLDLVIVPVSALHYVPFHALHDGENYLIESREVVVSPSAKVWKTLNSRPVKRLKSALLFGFADEQIPMVNQEIKALKNIFSEARSFVGKQASFDNFTEFASKFDILHLACHGNFRSENPLFSSLHLADGYVTVHDVCAQNLKADLVTLSACETGLNKIFAGEEILGLARGFLTAGASSLVLSLWTVNDAATTELMKEFYTELQRGKTVSASLRKAQQTFIERGAHPYFWSPFAIIGK